MLKIRLQRVGRAHEPVYRLVLTDSKNATKSGKYLENLGSFDSRRGEKAVFKDDRVKYWLSKGAQATGTVHNLLVSRKVVQGKKINVLPKKKPILKEGAETPTEAKKEIVLETPVSTPKEEVVETVSS
ncbi:MAG: 30S ribosomal protein S16 [Minisyncoccia bacterium]